MKRLKYIGKAIVAIGILALFREVNGFSGYGGYVDNAWEILLVSLVLIGIGVSIVLISKKGFKEKE